MSTSVSQPLLENAREVAHFQSRISIFCSALSRYFSLQYASESTIRLGQAFSARFRQTR